MNRLILPSLTLRRIASTDPRPHNREHLRDVDMPEPAMPSPPPQEPDDHPSLHCWRNETIEDAIADGMIGELYLCLCSEVKAVRMEALAGIQLVKTRIQVWSQCSRNTHI